MTEARTPTPITKGSESRSASNITALAHARPAVERWLAWSGLLPLPAFLAIHLAWELKLGFANELSELWRPAPSSVAKLTALVLVWIPLAVHTSLGVFLLLGKRRVSSAADDVPATPRIVSRVTSAISLAFLLYHAEAYSFSVWFGEASAEDAGFRLVAQLSSTNWGVPLVGGVYLLGLLATVAHAGLGIHRGLLLEGLLATPTKRRISARACTGFGTLLFAAGGLAVIRVASGVLLR